MKYTNINFVVYYIQQKKLFRWTLDQNRSPLVVLNFWAKNRNKIRPHFRGLNSKVHWHKYCKMSLLFFQKLTLSTSYLKSNWMQNVPVVHLHNVSPFTLAALVCVAFLNSS